VGKERLLYHKVFFDVEKNKSGLEILNLFVIFYSIFLVGFKLYNIICQVPLS